MANDSATKKRKGHKSAAADPKKEESSALTAKITLALLAVVALFIARGVWLGIHTESRESLELPSLSEEPGGFPEALAERGIPWEKIHHKMEGANLDKPRAYVSYYGQGRLHGAAWGEGVGLKSAVSDALSKAQAQVSGTQRKATPDALMLVIPTDRTALNANNYKGTFSNVHRGVRGAFIEPGADSPNQAPFRLSPTETVATNLPIVDALEREAAERKVSLDEWITGSEVYSFDAEQYYIPLNKQAKAESILRGNQLIPASAVTQKSVTHFADLLGKWLFSNLHPGGRMTYMYFPSTGRESPSNSNNMIRQWMATVAMGRVARLHPELNLESRVEENIRYNLAQFYKSEGDLGYIEWGGNAKLGAAALAMISLIESPARASFAEYERGLYNLTLNQWQPSGEFHCFYKPKSRQQDNLHNFYPGETLLGWSFLYAERPDPQLLDKTMKSFRYYKTWHLRNRNPAFIPWHTQAYYTIWKETKNEDLKDWIFEMNDWLIDTMQADSRVAYDDTLGRFYSPTGSYGPPHASSTGVYLEGLIDAFALARAIGDKKHEEKYRKSIILGLRSGMQLQYQDEVDLYYVRDKERVLGGMRTTVYDNEIRADNVQHILMGVQKILEEFRPEDYRF